MNQAVSTTRLHIALIAFLVLYIGIPSLFTRDLWNPDEPRYMEVAKEMAVSGDYVLPHLNSQVYAEKGPVFFWLTGILYKAGLGNNSGRVLTILSVIGTLVLTYLAFQRFVGASAGLLGAVLALSTLLLLHFAKIGVVDPLIMFFETGALILGFYALRPETSHRWRLWIACYVLLGLAVLTKGPVGIVVPGLILAVYGVLNRRNVKAGGKAHLLGTAGFALVALAWLIPAIIVGGREYAYTILFKQSVGRVVNAWTHQNPWYYYLVDGPVYFFPWSLILPLAIIAAYMAWRRTRSEVPLFASAWIVVTLVFLSALSGKRINYIVPILPAVGLLTAWYLGSEWRSQGRLQKAEKWLMGAAIVVTLALALMLAVGAATAPKLLRHYAEGTLKSPKFLLKTLDGTGLSLGDLKSVISVLSPAKVYFTIFTFIIAATLAAAALVTPARAGIKRGTLLAAAVFIFSLPLDVTIAPVADVFKSGRNFCIEVNRRVGPSGHLFLYDKSFSGVYNLYTGRVSIPVIDPIERYAMADKELARISASLQRQAKERGYAEESTFTDLFETLQQRASDLRMRAGADLRHALESPDNFVIANLDDIQKLGLESYTVLQEGIGHRAMVLVKGKAAAASASEK